MADTSGLLMLVGAATPPGRLATAVAAAAGPGLVRRAGRADRRVSDRRRFPRRAVDLGLRPGRSRRADRYAGAADAPPRPGRARSAASRRKIHLKAEPRAAHETAPAS